MKLRVRGVEIVEITDPKRLCGHRKKLDRGLLQQIKGQAFTAKQLKQMFGYGENTALGDTQLADLVEAVDKKKVHNGARYASYSEERSTKWRVL